ncbi:hypothetical protein AVEN_266817-1, partial [Araneus ventricosus]
MPAAGKDIQFVKWDADEFSLVWGKEQKPVD